MGIRAWMRRMRVRPPKDRKRTARDVAEYFIARSEMRNDGQYRSDGWYDDRYKRHEPASLSFDIDSVKIHFLVYYAEAWCLALLGESLFEEDIELFGGDGRPDIRSIYFEYQCYGFNRIPLTEPCDERLFTSEQLEVLDAVWRVYGEQHRMRLSGVFHRELPFQQTKRQGKRIISRETMRVYYKSSSNEKKEA